MRPNLPLDEMSVSEKIILLEEIWDSLRAGKEEIPSPAWHEDVLRAREKRVQEGSSQFIDWQEAKRRLRNRDK
jgi:putative addiction module component (TIGR02574 family)